MDNKSASQQIAHIGPPIQPEELVPLDQVQVARAQVADRLLQLEQERVRLIVAAQQLDTQKNRVFERINVDRGLPPNFPGEIIQDQGQWWLHPLAPLPEDPPPADKPASGPIQVDPPEGVPG